MLCNIDESSIENSQRILILLCFVARSLTVPELIDGIAVDIDSARLNVKRRLQNADDIHEICLGLVKVNIVRNIDENILFDGEMQIETICIAHFSVQEYLQSKLI